MVGVILTMMGCGSECKSGDEFVGEPQLAQSGLLSHLSAQKVSFIKVLAVLTSDSRVHSCKRYKESINRKKQQVFIA